MAEPLSILLLADDQKGHPNTIHDHIQAFRRYSRHDVTVVNPRNLDRSRVLRLGDYDAVVVHYSIVVIWDTYLSPWFRDQIAAYDGLKVQFIQDEYRWVDDIAAMSRHLGVNVFYSVVPTPAVPAVYGDRLGDTEILFTLTGYVPEELPVVAASPFARRPIDVGYRGRSTPMWLGRLGFEKIEIGRGFLRHAGGSGLRLDIAWTENARIYGDAWNDWVASCKATLASESGSSIVDYDRSIETAVRAYLSDHPSAAYEQVEQDVLARFAPTAAINTVSPRLFEAAALGTAMIMFPGEYSGIVEPWEHYIPLAKDFSNIDEVVERVRDVPFLEAMRDRAHRHVIASGQYSYSSFIAGFDDDLAARAVNRHRRPRARTAALHLEQLSSGRGYRISTVYGTARQVLLATIGVRHALRSAPLRTLLRRSVRAKPPQPGATTLWDDVTRLALMTSIAERSVMPRETFWLEADYDPGDGRLTLTSTPSRRAMRPSGLEDAVASAIRAGDLREVVWNHAPVGQYVTLPIPGTPQHLGFDVGRYDAFGIYRFDRLVEVGSSDPELLVAALDRLLRASA